MGMGEAEWVLGIAIQNQIFLFYVMGCLFFESGG